MNDFKAEARWYLDRYMEGYQECPNEREQYGVYSKIGFAHSVGLIDDQEAAEYCRRIGLDKDTAVYGEWAAIKEAKGA